MLKIQQHQRNRTTELFHKLNRVVFYCSSINFWVEDLDVPNFLVKPYKILAKLINVAVCLFLSFEWAAFYTQHNLSQKQKADRFLMSFSHTILYSFTFVIAHHRERVRKLLFTLSVVLKENFNDEEVERMMLKRVKFYAAAFVIICGNALVFYGIDGLIQFYSGFPKTTRLRQNIAFNIIIGTFYEMFLGISSSLPINGGTFVTLIPFWPDVGDKRLAADIARIATYIFWWIFMTRITAVYLLVLAISICLSHQYTNLQLYFKSLDDIFHPRNVSQRIKEARYERALKVGIKLHANTIWCTQQVEKTCGVVFSGQIIVNITVLVMLMSQLVNTDRTIGNTMPIAATITSMLFSTGVIMWNVGDVTVEAAHLPTAMFLSGWQNCQDEASLRIRRLLLIAITQSQKPVVIKCLGVVTLSYQSYLSIVKTSYSIFSVLF